ncbi:hypothetical protein N7510_006626 [Penicillium lagena]|uniref:uncharacterized protein n=1 Tax=Penicillium lagena TaxID=94218 RepID=UPI002540C37E|nr:uncharacterized protein N7510_006626 [Penicillium lagena]KAJ5613432.1 hypothetical protein N7510_006626 [Penicillium lagena]
MIERASAAPTPTTADLRLWRKGIDNTLLQLPSYYILNYNFTRINLWWLRRYVRSIILLEQSRRDALPSDTIGEEPCNYDQSAPTPANIFDNYRLRGNLLSYLSIFEYYMIVRTKRRQDATTEDLRLRVGQDLMGALITLLVYEIIPLNKKQRIVIEKVLGEVLIYANHLYDPLLRKQTLLYVGGKCRVGKSQIIKAIVAAIDLINRKNEVILMALTGAAANVIRGGIYYTSLRISLNRYQRAIVGLRSPKTIMIIDEMSIVDLTALSIINTHYKSTRSLDRSSLDLFSGLPIVILIGDFY